MSFTDMVQILCAGDRSIEVIITTSDSKGHVFVENGNIVHVSYNDIQGEDAFYKLMMLTEGEFVTKQCSEFPVKSIQASAMSLLMEGARLSDEIQSLQGEPS